tara:strand:+ start:1301 stop:2545 length:1245 start_codon:yes stop_codon:yes gene_type:complete
MTWGSATVQPGDDAGGLRPAHRLLLAQVLDRPAEDGRHALDAMASGERQAFVDAARHHFVSALVLDRLGGARQPGDGRETLRRLALDAGKTARRSLLIAATLGELHRDHLAPLAIDYVTFKGVSLASRYYGQLALRACRDLDLLVDRRAIPALTRRLLDAGFTFAENYAPQPGSGPLGDYIDAVAYLTSEFTLVSPAGVLVEIHSRLDLTGPGFTPVRLLAHADRCEMSGTGIPVLPTGVLFPYICYHHSRHRWSRLHWLADLTAMMRHPSFDAAEARRQGRRMGLGRLVEGCMALPDALQARLEGAPPDARSGVLPQLATFCWTYTDPAVPPPETIRVAAEEDPRARMRERLSNTAWDFLARDTLLLKVITGLTQLRPHLPDYTAFPLPRRLHAVYWATRPFRLLRKAAERRA